MNIEWYCLFIIEQRCGRVISSLFPPHTHYMILFYFCSFWHSLCAAAVVLLLYIVSSFAVSMFVLKLFHSFIHTFRRCRHTPNAYIRIRAQTHRHEHFKRNYYLVSPSQFIFAIRHLETIRSGRRGGIGWIFI